MYAINRKLTYSVLLICRIILLIQRDHLTAILSWGLVRPQKIKKTFNLLCNEFIRTRAVVD
jgi:hypothetical protein